MKYALIALLASTQLLSGCMISHDYARFERPKDAAPATLPSGGTYATLPDAAQQGLPWQQVFTDPQLAGLIDTALANNRDIRAAIANIGIARAQYRIQRSAQLPTITANGSTTRSELASAFLNQIYSADIGISAFELDLFGRVKSMTRAELENYLATQEAARSARISIIAEIASAYATLASDIESLGISERTAASGERSLRLVQSLNKAGLLGKLDVRQSETIVGQAKADIAALKTQIEQDRNAMALLLGAPLPADFVPVKLSNIAPSFQDLPVGLSSEILLARPDVLQAEHVLRGANANVDAARAAFFPQISLTGLLGFSSISLSNLFTGDQFGWSVTGNGAANIFGGTNPGNLKLSKAQRDLYVAQYEKAVQTAFREVSDALARRATLDEQRVGQTQLLTASEQNLKLSEARYKAGVDAFLTTLDAQRTYYNAQKTALTLELTATLNKVEVYRAVGNDGGPPAVTSTSTKR